MKKNKAKKIIPVVLIILIAISALSFLVPSQASAAVYATDGECQQAKRAGECKGECKYIASDNNYLCLGGSEATTGKDEKTAPFGFGWVVDTLLALPSAALNLVATLLLTVSSLILGVSGLLLNQAVLFTIADMAQILKDVNAIDIGWTLIRDFTNIIFIFLLLYISIATILRIEGFGAKRLLTRVIIAALLINFSLFFTKVVIDVSNVIAYKFYEPIVAIGEKADSSFDPEDAGDEASVNLTGFAGAFMEPLELETLYGGSYARGVFDFETVVRQVFGIIFVLTAAFVFFTAALLLLVRFIVVIILMITSPFAFIGIFLPATKKTTEQWWNTLWDMAIWPPAFMLLSLIAYIVISSPGFKAGINSRCGGAVDCASFNSVFSGESVIAILNFVIVIGFLIMALTIAKTLGKRSAQGLTQYTDRFQKGAVGFVKGSTFLGKAPVGVRGAAAKAVQAVAKKKGGGVTGWGARALRTIPGFSYASGRISQAADKDVEAAKKRYSNMTVEQLQNLAQQQTVTSKLGLAGMTKTNRLAIMELLSEKNKLKPTGRDVPLISTRGGFGRYDVDSARKEADLRGRSTKPIDSKFYQYAQTPEEYAYAIKGGFIDEKARRGERRYYDRKEDADESIRARLREIKRLKSTEIEEMDLKKYFTFEGIPADQRDRVERGVRMAQISTWGKAELNKLQERTDEAPAAFFRGLTQMYHDENEGRDHTIENLSEWLSQRRTPVRPNAPQNRKLAGWVRSPEGKAMMTSLGFTDDTQRNNN